MSNVLVKTDLKIQGLNNKYTGKVRDVYKLKNNLSEPIFKILKGNKFLNNYATFFSN